MLTQLTSTNPIPSHLRSQRVSMPNRFNAGVRGMCFCDASLPSGILLASLRRAHTRSPAYVVTDAFLLDCPIDFTNLMLSNLCCVWFDFLCLRTTAAADEFTTNPVASHRSTIVVGK